tara:strand:- start:23198 stop:24109 length:912 start_codon:yes stop_codon:yes gene_type:complete
MKSVVRFHFPQVVFEKQQKKLFNPVLKKRFKNRPEERVRLKWVEYLLHETDWNRNRISFESPVSVRQTESTLRADLILYSEELKPKILIECKSDKVALTGKTGEQIARYNSDLKAPFLILSNGVVDLNYEIREKEAVETSKLFSSKPKKFERDSNYWSKRGFSGLINSEQDQEIIPNFLNQFWNDSIQSDIRYLAFKSVHIDLPIDQYYRIFQADNVTKLAISTVGHSSSESYLVAVLNQKGVNRAILYLNLNKMIENRPDPVLKVSEEGQEIGELKSDISGYFTGDKEINITDFSTAVLKLF